MPQRREDTSSLRTVCESELLKTSLTPVVKAAWTESCREGVGPRDPAPSWGSPASASVSSLFSSGTPPLGVPPLPPKLLVLTMALSVGFVPLTSGGILGWLSVPRAEEGTFMRTRGTHGEAFLSGVLCGVLRPSCPALSCAVLGLEPALPGRGLGCMTGLEPEALVLTPSSLPLRALPGCRLCGHRDLYR